MKIRQHRATLEEAMLTVEEIEPTLKAVEAWVARTQDRVVKKNNVLVNHYAMDHRIGWNTYIVTFKNMAIGFTDGPIKEVL